MLDMKPMAGSGLHLMGTGTTMDVDEVIDRAATLKNMVNMHDRTRLRDVMNGGAEGVKAVLDSAALSTGPSSLGVDLPTANIMHSGMERISQKIGRAPTLKTDMLPLKDTNKARKGAEKRARIVTGWDEMATMELQYPQMGRWLTGYGFTVHIIKERDFGGVTYPVAELRDPYDAYPGQWGPTQQPSELAIYRKVSKRALMRSYPQHRAEINAIDEINAQAAARAAATFGQNTSGWEGKGPETLTVIEYMCLEGTYVVCLEYNLLLSFIPNPLSSGPAFVVTKRFSFDKLQGQFHHIFGLMAMMAKLNILGLIGVEDSTFKETNVIGEMVGDVYKRGRFAFNQFERGTTIEKPTSDQLQQTWQAINILERQMRVVSGYPVADDGQSPNSFATGQGIRELGASANENVREYQTSIKHSIELIDRKRLEWEEVMHPNEEKRVFWYEGGEPYEETYIPTEDINKDYRTKRIYGAMATFDENSKIVAGLQLVQARIMDRRTMQENLDGFDNVSLINERIDQDQAKEMLLQSLGQRAAQGDATADMALVAILDKPSTAVETLKKLFTPEKPEPTPEEMAMMAGQGQPGMPGMPGGEGDPLAGGPPPGVQTILSQMEAPGGGAQMVGQM